MEIDVTLEDSEVAKIAMLARIGVDEDDLHGYAEQLTGILELVKAMDSIDTTQVEPMAHPQDQSQRRRPDEATEVVDRDTLQKGAPRVEDGLYLVPRVLE